NYLGQGAWILSVANDPALQSIEALNPFYQMLPEMLRPFAVGLSALAAIIASQALITGSYTLVSEATHLDLMPHMDIDYPSDTKGQLYIPLVNNIMWAGCTGVVLLFQTSSHMEAAYGLAITMTMLMTTLLLYIYISRELGKKLLAIVFAAFFLAIESAFFLSSLTKFTHGGYVTVFMAAAIFLVMYVWRRSTAIERGQTVYLRVKDYVEQLERLRDDESINLLASNLVFLTNDSSLDRLDRDILYSILDKRPKRARAYWFVNMKVTDEPYTNTYTVNTFGTDFIFKVQLQLGFRVEQRVNAYLRQIVSDLIESGEIAPQGRTYSIYRNPGIVGDFRFVMLRKQVTPDTDLRSVDLATINAKYAIREFCGSPAQWYGLETSNAVVEYVPLFTRMKEPLKLERIPFSEFENSIEQAEERRRRQMELSGKLPVIEQADIFSSDVEGARADIHADISTSIIGGDTAVFDAILDAGGGSEEE
ncbi:MAG: KUP/HAK/KT family potassium transporter, partial [Atopobiaceae bacterium]|nr:KUP/HAK/KT family potassium transporter [Atopobiaceae bacterium]